MRKKLEMYELQAKGINYYRERARHIEIKIIDVLI